MNKYLMDNNTCRMVSFNCKNVKTSVSYIRELCKSSDIIALQETWLLPHEIPLLSTIDDDFNWTGTSAVDTGAGILRGRPYGGVALLWRKGVFKNVTVVKCNENPRLCAIKVEVCDRSLLVISVYMPTDKSVNLPIFTDCLGAVSAIVDNEQIECVFVLGDFNAHPSEPFFGELSNFCSDQVWTCADTELLGLHSDTYTFISDVYRVRHM